MDLESVQQALDGVPYMSLQQARTIVGLLTEHGSKDVLELGFMHGVSTCYMAAGLEELGRDWHITTIDLVGARSLDPNTEQLLTKLGLRDRVSVVYEPTSYTWALMKMLEADATPRFDFCYLDGAHSWFVDGFAFFLVDRLLKPGGWIVFDDLDWSYDKSPALRDTDLVRQMPEDERKAEQVKKVYELLVKTHPDYSEFSVDGAWGFAQKQERSQDGPVRIRREVVTKEVGLGAVAKQLIRKVRSRVGSAK